MAEKKITFTKVAVLGFDKNNSGSGKVRLSCAPSAAVVKAMEWDELPQWQKSATPQDAKLVATIAEFVPTHGDLKKHAFDLQATAVDGFEFVRVLVTKGKTAKKSKTFRLELHCAIHFSDPQGATKLERYMGQVIESTVRITYQEAAEQEELLATEEQRQATLAEND